MSGRARANIRWIVGMIAAGLLMAMSYQSLAEGFSLSTPVIVGMLALIVLLVFGVEELEALIDAVEDLVESWRG